MAEQVIQKLQAWAKELKTETYALYLAYKDPRTPWHGRVFTGLVVAYAFSPIDLIPDPIPVLGYLDDLILVPLGIMLAVKMIPGQVMAECRKKAISLSDKKGPKNWTAAAIIVIFWLILAAMAINIIYRMT